MFNQGDTLTADNLNALWLLRGMPDSAVELGVYWFDGVWKNISAFTVANSNPEVNTTCQQFRTGKCIIKYAGDNWTGLKESLEARRFLVTNPTFGWIGIAFQLIENSEAISGAEFARMVVAIASLGQRQEDPAKSTVGDWIALIPELLKQSKLIPILAPSSWITANNSYLTDFTTIDGTTTSRITSKVIICFIK